MSDIVGETYLSSNWTFFYKFVFPTLWISGFGLGTVQLWLGNFHGAGNSLPPPELKLVFSAVWIIGSAFILVVSASLKRVRFNGQLLVSNYFREIRIPLNAVIDVKQNRWMNWRPITIYLREPTEFGDRVAFMPRQRFRIQFWRADPIVAELKQLAGLMPQGAPGTE
jgi:hypothetical protein